MSDDLFKDAHDAGERALELLMDAGDCACDTCIVRELLTAAWPHLKQAALEGYE